MNPSFKLANKTKWECQNSGPIFWTVVKNESKRKSSTWSDSNVERTGQIQDPSRLFSTDSKVPSRHSRRSACQSGSPAREEPLELVHRVRTYGFPLPYARFRFFWVGGWGGMIEQLNRKQVFAQETGIGSVHPVWCDVFPLGGGLG